MPEESTPASRARLCSPAVQEVIGEVAERLAELQRHWPKAINLSVENETSVYDAYPFFFLPAFPVLAPPDVVPLALAARLFASSLFVADDLMDEPVSRHGPVIDLLRVQAMQCEGYRLLGGLFPAGSPFWDRFRDYLAAYAHACLEERQFVDGFRPAAEYSLEVALGIARGKSGLARFVVAGLAEMAGDEIRLSSLTESILQYYVARQMLDDLGDWRQDLGRGFPSLLLVSAMGHDAGGGVPLAEPLAREIYGRGHADYVLRVALGALERAEQHLEGLPELPWYHLLRRLRVKIVNLAADLHSSSQAIEAPTPEAAVVG